MRRMRSGRSSASVPRPPRTPISSGTSRTARARCAIRLPRSTLHGAASPCSGSRPSAPTPRRTGYGPRFVAAQDTWVGIVPVGYADGFRRDLTGTTVRVGGTPRRVVGTVSMDAFAVELDGEVPIGTPVALIGNGVLAEEHARVAGTIPHDLVCGINSPPLRARRTVIDA